MPENKIVNHKIELVTIQDYLRILRLCFPASFRFENNKIRYLLHPVFSRLWPERAVRIITTAMYTCTDFVPALQEHFQLFSEKQSRASNSLPSTLNERHGRVLKARFNQVPDKNPLRQNDKRMLCKHFGGNDHIVGARHYNSARNFARDQLRAVIPAVHVLQGNIFKMKIFKTLRQTLGTGLAKYKS